MAYPFLPSYTIGAPPKFVFSSQFAFEQGPSKMKTPLKDETGQTPSWKNYHTHSKLGSFRVPCVQTKSQWAQYWTIFQQCIKEPSFKSLF